jgi:hypothetical protein
MIPARIKWTSLSIALLLALSSSPGKAQLVPGDGIRFLYGAATDTIAIDRAGVLGAADTNRWVSKTRPDSVNGDKVWRDGATFLQSIWQLNGYNLYHGAYAKSSGQSNGKFSIENTYPGGGGLIGFEITNNGIVYGKANGQVCFSGLNGKLSIGDTYNEPDSVGSVEGGFRIKGGLLIRDKAYSSSAFGRAASDSLMLATRAWVDTLVNRASRALAATLTPFDSSRVVSMNRADTRFGDLALAARGRLIVGTSIGLAPSDVRGVYVASDTATRRQTDDVIRIQQSGGSRVTLSMQETGIMDLPYQSFVYVIRSGDSTNQSGLGAGDHIVDFNEEYADTQYEWLSTWSPLTHPRTTRRFTATRNGVYLVCANVLVQTTGALNEQGALYLFVYKNGQAFVKGQVDNSRVIGSRSLAFTSTVELNAGDYIYLGLHSEVQNSGTVIWKYSANTYMQILKVK